MNYTRWKTMMGYHPSAGASWLQRRRGSFELHEDFYRRSGGIFETSRHYEALLSHSS